MTILDTSVVVERVRGRKPIREDITAVTLVEYPRIVYYKHFYGGIIFPIREDFILAHRMQLELLKAGRPQAFADLLVSAIAVNRDEELVTRDRDFVHIRRAARREGGRLLSGFMKIRDVRLASLLKDYVDDGEAEAIVLTLEAGVDAGVSPAMSARRVCP